MGLDGGTKITRSDVLRGQSWRMTQADNSRSTRGGSVNQVFQEQQLDQQARRIILWSFCALSGLPLAPPLVADALGQLLNRQAVLEHLLAARSSCDDEAAQLRYNNQLRASAGAWDHLRTMKDVFAVHPTPNPGLQQQHQQQQGTASNGAAASSRSGPSSSSSSIGGVCGDKPLWICPVTLLPCGNKQPFSALRACGHVMSDKAIAAVPEADRRCPVCEQPFDQTEVVSMNGSEEHMESVRQQLRAAAAVKAAAKAEKAKQKKRGQACLESSSDAAVLAITAAVGGGAASEDVVGGEDDRGQGLQQPSRHKAARLR